MITELKNFVQSGFIPSNFSGDELGTLSAGLVRSIKNYVLPEGEYIVSLIGEPMMNTPKETVDELESTNPIYFIPVSKITDLYKNLGGKMPTITLFTSVEEKPYIFCLLTNKLNVIVGAC